MKRLGKRIKRKDLAVRQGRSTDHDQRVANVSLTRVLFPNTAGGSGAVAELQEERKSKRATTIHSLF
jgi:hypothetical protein